MESAFGVDHGEVEKSLRGLGGALKDVARYSGHLAAKSHPAQMGKLNAQIGAAKFQTKVGIPVKYAAKNAASSVKWKARSVKASLGR